MISRSLARCQKRNQGLLFEKETVMKKRHWLAIALVSAMVVVVATEGMAVIEGTGEYETKYQSIAEDLGNGAFVVEGRYVRARIGDGYFYYLVVTEEHEAVRAYKAMRVALKSLFEKHPDLEIWRVTPLVQRHGYTICLLVETSKKQK